MAVSAVRGSGIYEDLEDFEECKNILVLSKLSDDYVTHCSILAKFEK